MIIYQNLEECLSNVTSKSAILSIEKDGYRNYIIFSNYIDMYTYVFSKKPHDRNFHEIIPRNKACKLFFDIDIDADHDRVIDQVCENLLEVTIKVLKDITKKTIVPENFFFLINNNTSKEFNKQHCENKQSIHIIFTEFNFSSMKVVKYIAEKVFNEMDEKLVVHVDKCVYKKNQSFRLPYCCKLGKPNATMLPITRMEILDTTITYNMDVSIQNLFIKGCLGSEIGTTVMIDIPKTVKNLNTLNISLEVYNHCISELKKLYKETLNCFEITQKGDYIILKRRQKSPCVICENSPVHESIDQYAFICKKKKGIYLMIGCWRCNHCIKTPLSIFK